MFSAISWESFLTICVTTVGGYYTITTAAFYRHEITAWIKSFSNPPSVSLTVEKKEVPNDMMGTAQVAHEQTPRTSFIQPEELITSEHGEEEEPEAIQAAPAKSKEEDLLIGTIADLLEEVKTLIQLIAEYRTGKSESEALFNALFIRYPHLQNTTYPLAISFYIAEASKEQFPYELTSDEVITWWGVSPGNSKK